MGQMGSRVNQEPREETLSTRIIEIMLSKLKVKKLSQ